MQAGTYLRTVYISFLLLLLRLYYTGFCLLDTFREKEDKERKRQRERESVGKNLHKMKEAPFCQYFLKKNWIILISASMIFYFFQLKKLGCTSKDKKRRTEVWIGFLISSPVLSSLAIGLHLGQ